MSNAIPCLEKAARFEQTRWTVVLAAAADGPARAAAWDQLCRSYWYPVYAFVRRRGHGPEDARDLTQGFFARMIEKDWLAGVERRETARFSTLLLTMLERFLVNEYERGHAAKRGAGVAPISIDVAVAESWFGAEPATEDTPRNAFERRWALAVLAAAHERLRAELTAAGKARHFEVLSPFLSREPEPGDYEATGAVLDIAARSVAVAVHRLRSRFRDAVRAELTANSCDAAQGDEEMRQLFAALA